MSWRSVGLLSGLAGLRRGEPVAFEFAVQVQTLEPWPSAEQRPVRRLALRWARGKARPLHARARLRPR
jgi:hypothetical protein